MSKLFNLLFRHRYDILFSFLLIFLFYIVFFLFPKDETKDIVNFLENKTFDIRQRLVSKNKLSSNDIWVITVDDPSYEYLLETYGDWPIPRHVYAEVLDFVQAQNPKYVAFDLLFVKSLNRVAGSDERLIESFRKYPNTYTGLNFDSYDYVFRQPPILPDNLKTDIQIKNSFVKPYLYPNCRAILSEIMQSTSNVGHINTPKDDDGSTRVVPAFINYPLFDVNNNFAKVNDNYYLYMTLKMMIDYLNKYENANITDILVDEKGNLVLGNKKIPLTKKGEIILNWYARRNPDGYETFNFVSFAKVLMSINALKEGKPSLLPPDYFKDKIVFVGTSVFALSDVKTVPIGKYLPGVEIHTTLFNNILENCTIKKLDNNWNFAFALFLSIFAVLFVSKIRSVFVSVVLFTSTIFLYLYITTFVMAKFNLWIGIIIPVLFPLLIFVGAFLVKYLFKSRDFEYTYKLATTDGLTELYNHRFFQEQMKKKIDLSAKLEKPFSLILIDIDFFKKFNDKYGHQAGDAVLKHVAKTLKTSVRAEDFVCRYGGEEMAIILNNADRDLAVSIAQKICRNIAEKEYELTPDLSVHITISLGVSTYPINGKTPTELIEYSDKCLYKAKENGRNQVGFIE